MSSERIFAYKAEIGRVQSVKAKRAATIIGLCSSVETMWDEMGFGPGDDFEAAIPKRGEVSGTLRALSGCPCACHNAKTDYDRRCD